MTAVCRPPCRLPRATCLGLPRRHMQRYSKPCSRKKRRDQKMIDDSSQSPTTSMVACPFRAWSHGRHVRFSLLPWSWLLLGAWALPIPASAARVWTQERLAACVLACSTSRVGRLDVRISVVRTGCWMMVERMLTSRAHNGSLMKSQTELITPSSSHMLQHVDWWLNLFLHVPIGLGAAKRSQQQANTTLSSSERSYYSVTPCTVYIISPYSAYRPAIVHLPPNCVVLWPYLTLLAHAVCSYENVGLLVG